MQRARLQKFCSRPRRLPIRSRPARQQVVRICATSRPSVTASPAERHGSLTISFGTSSRRRHAMRRRYRDDPSGRLRPCARNPVLLQHDADRARPRPARSLSQDPTWRKSTFALRPSRSVPPPEARAEINGLDQARPSRCRRARVRDCPCSGEHARSIAPPNKRAHCGQEFGFIGEAEKAFELACEVGALAILDQRRRAHDAERRCLALRCARPSAAASRISGAMDFS